MNRRMAPRCWSGLAAATLAIVPLLAPAPAASQVAEDVRLQWPQHLSAIETRPLDTPEPVTLQLAAPQADDSAIRFVTSVVVTSIGSVAGLYGGAWVGVHSTDEYGSGWYSETTGAWVGAGIGTSVGAITASGLINGHWGRSVLGSFAGTAVGAFLGMAVEASYRSGVAGIATYGLTHGLITTVVAGS